LNTRHEIYKKRGFAQALPPRAELFELIMAEPNLLRRPIVRKGKKLVIGFDQAALQKL
jgi:arsenate reductase-like glutaredoxin family protein